MFQKNIDSNFLIDILARGSNRNSVARNCAKVFLYCAELQASVLVLRGNVRNYAELHGIMPSIALILAQPEVRTCVLQISGSSTDLRKSQDRALISVNLGIEH